MLDNAGIIFSTVMMLVVMIRAIRLDREQPWFQTLQLKRQGANEASRPWSRRN